MITDLPNQNEETYLGDGLYASFDGFQVILRAPRDGGDHFIGLEPVVWRELMIWVRAHPRLDRHLNEG